MHNEATDTDKNKTTKINELWEELQAEIHRNLTSEKGILNRQIHSIQTEGYFGDIKENEIFRRFHYRSTEKIYKEFLLFAVRRNVNKYHRFLHGDSQKFEGKTEQKSAKKIVHLKNKIGLFSALKNRYRKQKEHPRINHTH